jgi:membrane-bound acyltransferase YfiQ involved in biofilm formation
MRRDDLTGSMIHVSGKKMMVITHFPVTTGMDQILVVSEWYNICFSRRIWNAGPIWDLLLEEISTLRREMMGQFHTSGRLVISTFYCFAAINVALSIWWVTTIGFTIGSHL